MIWHSFSQFWARKLACSHEDIWKEGWLIKARLRQKSIKSQSPGMKGIPNNDRLASATVRSQNQLRIIETDCATWEITSDQLICVFSSVCLMTNYTIHGFPIIGRVDSAKFPTSACKTLHNSVSCGKLTLTRSENFSCSETWKQVHLFLRKL